MIGTEGQNGNGFDQAGIPAQNNQGDPAAQVGNLGEYLGAMQSEAQKEYERVQAAAANPTLAELTAKVDALTRILGANAAGGRVVDPNMQQGKPAAPVDALGITGIPSLADQAAYGPQKLKEIEGRIKELQTAPQVTKAEANRLADRDVDQASLSTLRDIYGDLVKTERVALSDGTEIEQLTPDSKRRIRGQYVNKALEAGKGHEAEIQRLAVEHFQLRDQVHKEEILKSPLARAIGVENVTAHRQMLTQMVEQGKENNWAYAQGAALMDALRTDFAGTIRRLQQANAEKNMTQQYGQPDRFAGSAQMTYPAGVQTSGQLPPPQYMGDTPSARPAMAGLSNPVNGFVQKYDPSTNIMVNVATKPWTSKRS